MPSPAASAATPAPPEPSADKLAACRPRLPLRLRLGRPSRRVCSRCAHWACQAASAARTSGRRRSRSAGTPRASGARVGESSETVTLRGSSAAISAGARPVNSASWCSCWSRSVAKAGRLASAWATLRRACCSSSPLARPAATRQWVSCAVCCSRVRLLRVSASRAWASCHCTWASATSATKAMRMLARFACEARTSASAASRPAAWLPQRSGSQLAEKPSCWLPVLCPPARLRLLLSWAPSCGRLPASTAARAACAARRLAWATRRSVLRASACCTSALKWGSRHSVHQRARRASSSAEAGCASGARWSCGDWPGAELAVGATAE